MKGHGAEWDDVSLEEFGAIIGGGTPSRSTPSYWNGSIPWITPGELKELGGRYVRDTREKITPEGLSASAAKLLPAGSLLVTTRATIGEVAIASVPVATNQGFKNIVPNGRTDSLFAYYRLGALRSEMERLASGTTFLEISKSDFSRIRTRRPRRPEQTRIAAVLDTLDEAIANTEAVIAKLKQVRAGLLHDLLTRGLDENGQLRDPVAHPERFKDSPVGRIPRAWQVCPLEQVAEVDRGKFTHRPRNDPAFYGGECPFIQTGDVALAGGEVIIDASQSLNPLGVSVSREFPTGTIAVTIAANIGDTAILGRPMYFPDSVVGVVAREPHSARWIELSLRRAKQRLDASAPQSAQKNINLESLRPLLVPVPGPDEQARCSRGYEHLSSVIRKESESLGKTLHIRSGLMADLLTGRVRVPESIMADQGEQP